MSEIEIKIPNIGDFKGVEVIEVLVTEGQTLKKNDPLITIESDKSSVEIPSNFDGKIKNLKIKVGDKVSEGDLILPSKFDGISTLDLSLSIVIKGSFFFNIWPSETKTSITSTSLKSPILGIFISISDIII